MSAAVYFPGMGGDAGISPALAQLDLDVVVAAVPGFGGEAGFEAPTGYLDWIVAACDALDATGATAGGPVTLIGASVGGMLAAELAALRPELVSRVVLLAPFGIADEDAVGFDYFSLRGPDRLAHLFAKGVPDAFEHQFDDRGTEEAPVARYIVDIATGALTWPLGDRGTARRLHRIRCPRLVVWGDQDELLPVSLAAAWGGAEVIDGGGHLVEWDCPDEVAAAIREFLA